MGFITELKWYHWLLIIALTGNTLISGDGGGPAYTLGAFTATTLIVAGIRHAWPSKTNSETEPTA